MRTHTLLHAGTAIVGLTAALLFSAGAAAQSTGNPKGTVAPPSGDTSAPATAPPSSGMGTDSGKLSTGPAKARGHTNRSPGTGTAGGLPKKTPEDGGPQSRAQVQGGSSSKPPPK